MMTHQDYLIKRGWQPHDPGSYMWVDPVDSQRYMTTVALDRQRKRDAANLDTALAALESAEPLLEALADEGRYVESVAEALTKIRAVREGRNA